MKKQKRQPKIFSRPSSASGMVLFILSAIYIPNLLPLMENLAGVQLFFAILLAPLLVIIPLESYKVGTSLVFFDPAKNKTTARTRLISICIAIAIAAMVVQIMCSGYPIRICFDTCIKINTLKAFVDYFICTLILTIPAWIGIAKYDSYDFSKTEKIEKAKKKN